MAKHLLAIIKNKSQLINKGNESTRNARLLILESYEAALNAVKPEKLIKSKISFQTPILKIENLTFDLRSFKNIYVVGGGKASGEMAAALEHILGKWIKKGIVNVPRGNGPRTNIIILNQASHPLPDQSGIEGTKQMLKIAEQATQDDLLICLISGGGSSLMPMPREELALKDKQELTQKLLKSGANISEINIVRKHLSAFKGGFLAKKAYPATILNLIISDVVGDKLGDVASGPTVPDVSTFTDAQNVLVKYKIWDSTPLSIQTILKQGQQGKIAETPKPDQEFFKKVYNVILANNQSVCTAVRDYFDTKGINTYLLPDPLEGEARQVATAIAQKIQALKFSKPFCFIGGGETTVTVSGKGLGGRNQELSLALAIHLFHLESFVFASLSTDGIDGPTDAAGAIVDDNTLNRAKMSGLNPKYFLKQNNSYRFFSILEDLVITGKTGTNVNDIAIIILS